MFALDDAPVRLGLARFDHLVLVVRDEKLEAVLQKGGGCRLDGISIPAFIEHAINC